jgi:Arc/MetJ-type ribon-helix-helix transcriptional regulator
MKRTTITLSDELASALGREARRRDKSASEIAREALAKHLGVEPGQPRRLPWAGLGRSGRPNTARDMEALIEREWDDDARGR